MQFNDTTSRSGLIQDCEDWCGFDATGISGNTAILKIFTRNINAWYHKVITMILNAQDEWDYDDSNKTDYPIATTPLVAGQRDYTYPASLKILKVKRVDITYNGTTYYKAEPIDSGEISTGLGTIVDEDGKFSKSEPFYDAKANAIWIYPSASASDVTAGGKIRIEFYREPSEFTTASTTTEPGIDEPFHRMLSLGASLDYSVMKKLPQKNDIATLLQDYERRLNIYYGSKQQDRKYTLKAQYEDFN